MKMQPRSIMQAGVMPLHGMGILSGEPSGAAMFMPAAMSALIGMATTVIACNVVALKNAMASRVLNRCRVRRRSMMVPT